MSTRNKLKKFSDLLSYPFVYENFDTGNNLLTKQEYEEVDMVGKWNSNHFKNGCPITLELACGRGEYTIALARKNKQRNFIGIDIKGARIWQGAQYVIQENLINAAFLRTRIEFVDQFFKEDEVDEIWITFPDPFLRKSKSNRRLTAHPFIDRYQKILKKGGFIHLKTDSPQLYEFTLESFKSHPSIQIIHHDEDIYSRPLYGEDLIHKTYYEVKNVSNSKGIKYILASVG